MASEGAPKRSGGTLQPSGEAPGAWADAPAARADVGRKAGELVCSHRHVGQRLGVRVRRPAEGVRKRAEGPLEAVADRGQMAAVV